MDVIFKGLALLQTMENTSDNSIWNTDIMNVLDDMIYKLYKKKTLRPLVWDGELGWMLEIDW